MGKVYIIGTGPGSRDYILPLAEKTIRRADIVIGAERLLSFCPKGKKTIVLKGNYSRVLDYIKKNKEKKKIAVLVSGSPGVFSFSRKIISALKHFEYEVIPGVSPLQIACALAGETWDDLRIVSLHGKTLRGLARKVIANKKVMVFCDNRNNPSYVAGYLIKKGIAPRFARDNHAGNPERSERVGKRKIIVFGNLSMDNEEIIYTDLPALVKSNRDWKGLWLILIKKGNFMV